MAYNQTQPLTHCTFSSDFWCPAFMESSYGVIIQPVSVVKNGYERHDENGSYRPRAHRIFDLITYSFNHVMSRHWRELSIAVKMSNSTRVIEVDALLQQFLSEENEDRSQHLLSELINKYVEPVIRHVIGKSLRSSTDQREGSYLRQEEQDLCCEAILRLLTRLRQIRQNPSCVGIADLQGYVAVIARNTCQEYLRRQHLEYKQLKDHIRYVLKHQPGFALWDDEQRGSLCGYAIWREQNRQVVSERSLKQVQNARRSFASLDSGDALIHSLRIPDLIALIFDKLGGPAELSHVVSLIARLRNVRGNIELHDQLLVANIEECRTEFSTRNTALESRIEQRLYLQRLWGEIGRLPLPHRTALLLNLKDAEDRGLIVLLVDLRIVTIRQIAETLELSPEEFAAVWNDLPWDDARIAIHLRTTRQTVINLRKSARRFLTQCMSKDGSE